MQASGAADATIRNHKDVRDRTWPPSLPSADAAGAERYARLPQPATRGAATARAPADSQRARTGRAGPHKVVATRRREAYAASRDGAGERRLRKEVSWTLRRTFNASATEGAPMARPPRAEGPCRAQPTWRRHQGPLQRVSASVTRRDAVHRARRAQTLHRGGIRQLSRSLSVSGSPGLALQARCLDPRHLDFAGDTLRVNTNRRRCRGVRPPGAGAVLSTGLAAALAEPGRGEEDR